MIYIKNNFEWTDQKKYRSFQDTRKTTNFKVTELHTKHNKDSGEWGSDSDEHGQPSVHRVSKIYTLS